MLVSQKTPNLLIDQLLSYTAPEDTGLDTLCQHTILVSEKTPSLLIDQLLSYSALGDIGLSARHAGERENTQHFDWSVDILYCT